jgi:hypothetical protein
VINKKKILLVTNAFYPEISPRSYRATELAREFCKQGHSVVVISKYRHHDYDSFLNKCNITIKMWGDYRFPQVPDFKRKPFAFISRVLKRILLTFFEYPGIEDMIKVKKMLKCESDHDLMISFAVPYPVHWGVAWARSEMHRIAITWVADCGDPYMGDVLDSFKKPFYFGYLEKWFCRKTDYITIPIESARQGYYEEFHHKIKIIPQGFDFDLEIKDFEKPHNEIPTFAYAGGFLPYARDPKSLMNSLLNLNIDFKFFVFTNKPDLLSDYKAALKEKLIISEYIPRNELMKILTGMDFLINFDNNTKLNSPSKLIDYAIANRPVLNITRNFNGNDLIAFLKRDYRSCMVLPEPEQYHIKKISSQFLDLIL